MHAAFPPPHVQKVRLEPRLQTLCSNHTLAMVSKRRFRDVPQKPYSPRPFYEQPWPADLPENCQVCGTKFRFRYNINYGLGRAGRILRRIAYLSLPFGILVGFAIPVVFPDFYESFNKRDGFWFCFAIMLIPPPILAVLSTVMPKSRHLVCKKCGWNRDYKPLPDPKLPPNAEEN